VARIKICGIKREEDALLCAGAGADAIGLVFAKSPRRVDVDKARVICGSLPPFISRVGVFVDEKKETIQEVARLCGLTALQFHGSEDAAFCREFTLPVLKAVRIRTAVDLLSLDGFPAAAIVLDTYDPVLPGGTGRNFEWSLAVDADAHKSIVLAGGLTALNVAEAIRQVRPYAVDVSSGVETDGEKDKEKIISFIKAVRGVF
jgi:phosphoribosylanthranilate isomerase